MGGDAPAGSAAEQRWDWLLRVAARVAGTSMAAISLLEPDRVVIRGGLGFRPGVMPADESLCVGVAERRAPLLILDAAADPRWRDRAIVRAAPHVRYYLGLPIPGEGGSVLGSLCCCDAAPRAAPPPAADLDLLADLAAQVGEGLRGEAAAARHARDLRAVVDAIPLPLMTVDRAGDVTAWNPAAERVFGWTAAEVLGRFGPHVPADEVAASRAIQLRIARGERLIGVEAERQRRDGERLPVSISSAPLRDAAGRPDGAVLILEDIGARRRAAAEAARRAARSEREAALLTGIATSRHLARGDSAAAIRRILAAAAERLEGCDVALWRHRPEAEGLRLAALLGAGAMPVAEADPRRGGLRDLPGETGLGSDRSIAAADLAQPPAAMARLAGPFRAAGYGAALLAPVRLAGRAEGVLAALAPGGRPWAAEDCGFLASLGDLAALALEAERSATAIHGLEEAKARAEAASLTKSRFLARMSHELRTPLNAIIGFGDLLRAPGLPEAEREEFADHVVTAGRQLLAALTAVLDHARVEGGTLVLARSRTYPASLIGASLAALAPEAAARGVTIERSDRPMPPLTADPERLRQAVTNLLSNAVKFSPTEGVVAIGGGYDPGTGYAFWVRDAGPGMTAEELASALEPFRQVEEGLNRAAGGYGLGLSLTRAFIEAHGGRLVLDSTPGQGTLAVITLPAECAVSPQPALPRGRSAS